MEFKGNVVFLDYGMGCGEQVERGIGGGSCRNSAIATLFDGGVMRTVLILGEEGLKNTRLKCWGYDGYDGSVLQGLPVGVLFVILRYVGVAGFVKWLFLSKNSRPFLFHTLCASPEGLMLLNGLLHASFGRAIEFQRRMDEAKRSAEWVWYTRESRNIPDLTWIFDYTDCLCKEYYINSEIVCHEVFHGMVDPKLVALLRSAAYGRRRMSIRFRQEPDSWDIGLTYGNRFDPQVDDHWEQVCIAQAEQNRLEYEEVLQKKCNAQKGLSDKVCKVFGNGPRLHELALDYTSMRQWQREEGAGAGGAEGAGGGGVGGSESTVEEVRL